MAGAGLWAAGTGAAGAAVAEPASPQQWNGTRSANGWPVLREASEQRVEGAEGVVVRLAEGEVATVLLYIARRFAYEVDMLRPGDLAGHTTERDIRSAFESNHLSGTALAIRPHFYPLGAQPGTGMDEREKTIVKDILADCQGVVAWGGGLRPTKESHFHIDVPPGDTRLRHLAARIQGWDSAPGQGAGTVDAFAPARMHRANALH
ncbi:hypothetical protein A6A06_28145 [Streptomyces sp. CB02923]|nr:hypothetical protein A6A06_28145 [Streptomyces sp. CB02923]